MRNVIGLVNFHTSPEIEPLTDSRPLGSTSFLGRYGLVDFALSNLCNSGISTVGLLVKDHQRSILKHLGTLDSWVTNTKIGQQVIMYNEAGHLHPETNTDLNNIATNDWMLYDSNANYVVIVPAHIVAPVDLRPILAEHISRHEEVTILTTKVKDLSKEFLGQTVMSVDGAGYASRIRVNDGSIKGPGVVSLSAVIINRTVLADMIHRYLPQNPTLDLEKVLGMLSAEGNLRFHAHMVDGYVRCIDSFEHYVQYSFELFDEKVAKTLFLEDWPIYTLTHDTPPALYGENSSVKNSFIANGAIIEGTVINSIIARNVKVSKGAVIKNSIIFSSVKVGEDAVVDNALVDKYSIITRERKVGGKKNTVYLKQGTIE